MKVMPVWGSAYFVFHFWFNLRFAVLVEAMFYKKYVQLRKIKISAH